MFYIAQMFYAQALAFLTQNCYLLNSIYVTRNVTCRRAIYYIDVWDVYYAATASLCRMFQYGKNVIIAKDVSKICRCIHL